MKKQENTRSVGCWSRLASGHLDSTSTSLTSKQGKHVLPRLLQRANGIWAVVRVSYLQYHSVACFIVLVANIAGLGL